MSIPTNIYNENLDEEGRKDENVLGDSGGRTVFGIDEKSNPGDPIFALADAAEAAGRPIATDPAVNARAYAYYNAEWIAWGMDEIPANCQHIFYRGCVNEGVPEMFKLLQQALVDLGQSVTVDGQGGPATFRAVVLVDPRALYDKLWISRAKEYIAITTRKIAALGPPDSLTPEQMQLKIQYLEIERGWLDNLF